MASLTQYYTATSFDGYIADQDNSLTWLFEADKGDQAGSTFAAFFAGVGAFVMGATTYEWILANDDPANWKKSYGDVPAWVFTHRELPRHPTASAAITFVRGDVRPVHAAMTEAAAGKNIWVVGGGELAGAFADAGLLDELHLGVAPVTLGGGAPLLPRRLLASRVTLSSVERVGDFAMLTYKLGPVA
jgi:dihydrofolate reductase